MTVPVAALPAVHVQDLTVVRGGVRAVDGVTLSIRAGQVTGLLGPSGCGKTTLLRSIVGVQIVGSGSVTVLGDPAGTPSLRSRVAYVTQTPSVYADLTVRSNLHYFATILGASDSDVETAIDDVDLRAEADRLVGRLSGGQRARVSLATALLGSPELLVLDEPTVGLDPVLRRDLWALFRRLADGGATLLVSSHVMDEATRCQRLVLMREGRVLADDTPEALLERTGTADMESAFLAFIDGSVL